MTSGPRLLIALPQLPHDPASGAARTASTTGELLAQAGFAVQMIATTASEGHAGTDVSRWLSDLNIDAVRERVGGGGAFCFTRRGVSYTLLDTADKGVNGWETSMGGAYDKILDEALVGFRPDILMTYGGSAQEVARQRRVHSRGVRVVLGLYNACYLSHPFFDHFDGVITPSEFLSAFYLGAIGLRSTALPTPLWPEDVLVKRHAPSVLTMVNPSLEKGLMFFASLAQSLGTTHPEIPIEVYASRGSGSFLMQAAFAGGVDLSAHPNLLLCDTETSPSSIYQRSRVVVVPSLVEDAAPRVIAEALVNGIPPLGSDRGGIPEMCADGGFVLSIPRTLDQRSVRVASPEAVRPWVEAIVRLFNHPTAWDKASERARGAGARYLAPAVTRTYVDYFGRLLAN